jgi:putative endonuclease
VSRTRSQAAGDAAEQVVVERLVAAGWVVLGRQVHAGRGELDAIAIDPGPPRTLVVLEVRWRRRRDFGLAEESFDRRKRARVAATAMRLLDRGRLPDGSPIPCLPLRIDLVVVEPGIPPGYAPRLRHHRDALGG